MRRRQARVRATGWRAMTVLRLAASEIIEQIQQICPAGQITSDFQKLCQALLHKYFASLPAQISSLIRTVSFRQEGRCARHETRDGMRWTRRRQASNSEPDE